MKTAIATPEILKAHFRELETRKPFLREILNSFGELMIAGAQAREAFAAHDGPFQYRGFFQTLGRPSTVILAAAQGDG